MSGIQRSGSLFEKLLIKVFRKYHEHNVSYNLIPSHVIKVEGLKVKGKECYREQLPYDFMGWTKVYNKKVLERPLPVGIEAKNILTGLSIQKKHIKAHQIDNLYTLNQAGGLGFLLIAFPQVKTIYRLTVNEEFYMFYMRDRIEIYLEEIKKFKPEEFTFKNPDVLQIGVKFK